MSTLFFVIRIYCSCIFDHFYTVSIGLMDKAKLIFLSLGSLLPDAQCTIRIIHKKDLGPNVEIWGGGGNWMYGKSGPVA